MEIVAAKFCIFVASIFMINYCITPLVGYPYIDQLCILIVSLLCQAILQWERKNTLRSCYYTVYITLYADDNILYTTIHSAEDLSNMNNELSKISDWLAFNKLSLNANKTKYMMFHAMNKGLSHLNQRIHINIVEIQKVNQFQFVGLTIDENLTWKHHINAITNKISRGTGIINRLKNCLPLSILRTLYCSLIQSHFDYTILAWGYEAQKAIQNSEACSQGYHVK